MTWRKKNELPVKHFLFFLETVCKLTGSPQNSGGKQSAVTLWSNNLLPALCTPLEVPPYGSSKWGYKEDVKLLRDKWRVSLLLLWNQHWPIIPPDLRQSLHTSRGTFFPWPRRLLMAISLLTAPCLHSPMNDWSREWNAPYIGKIQCQSAAFEPVPRLNTEDGLDKMTVESQVDFT